MIEDREAELLDALVERPDDLDTLRVLADWYADRDDPRGELIQLELAPPSPATGARIADLRRQHEAAWLAPYRAIDNEITFGMVRGHVATISGDSALVELHEAEILALRPLVETLGLIDVDSLAHWGTSTLLRRASRVVISVKNRRVPGWSSLPALPKLRELVLDAVALVAEELDEIVRIAPNLEQLLLSACRLPDDVDALGRFENLRCIHLPSCHLGPKLGRLLALCALREVAIPHNDLGDAGLRVLLPALAHVDELDVRDNDLTLDVLDELLATMQNAKELQLGGNAFGNTGCAKIAAWDRARSLEKLDLGDDVSNEGALALARASGLRNLRWLSLAGARLDDPTKDALRRSRHLANARIYAGDRMIK